jgi:hypothetical protein
MVAGASPFIYKAIPLSGDDAPEFTPAPLRKKTEMAVRQQGPIRFEDMGRFRLAHEPSIC